MRGSFAMQASRVFMLKEICDITYYTCLSDIIKHGSKRYYILYMQGNLGNKKRAISLQHIFWQISGNRMSKRNYVITQCLLSHGSPTMSSTWTGKSVLSQNYPSFQVVFLAGIKTIEAMMLPFGCNRSQPIPNILADTFFFEKW